MTIQELALRLHSIKGLGIRRVLALKALFPNIRDLFKASIQDLCRVPGIDHKLARTILNGGDQNFIKQQDRWLSNSAFELLTIFDERYPPRLKQIYDPPLLLFKEGRFIQKDVDAIAIVGTRTCTEYGKKITEMLVRGLVDKGLTIISGFARGIDTTAHQAALKYGGRTVAVLGNGIDRVYPPENGALRQNIIKQGVYLSEFPLGTKPDAAHFPQRNRIISGLSLGTIVIEAGERSGALLTAYYALDQNREVFAIPGRITDKKNIGTNKLIQKGAKLVTNVNDILTEIEAVRKFPRTGQQLKIDFQFEGDEKLIFDALNRDPMHIDHLCSKVDKNSHEVLSLLLSLELKGAVQQYAGKMFSKIG